MKRVVERSWAMRRPPIVVPNFMDVPAAPAPLPEDEASPTIVCIGRIEYEALLPALLASVVGDWTTRSLGIVHASYAIPPGSAVTPTYPGKTDGPVTISANGAFLASERTLQRDNFEETMGLGLR